VTVDGKNTVRCEVRAVRAGTIRGTMTYADKEPVVNGRVMLFRRKGGTVTPFFTEDVFTNDRGMYRIDGLTEGEYFVGVVTGKSMTKHSDFRGPATIPSAFHPGVRSLAEAKPVKIQSGTEVTGIDITIGDDVSRRISGVLKWRGGEPVSEGNVTMRRKDDPVLDVALPQLLRTMTPPDADKDDTMGRDLGLMTMIMPQTADVGPGGTWQFDDLAPGTYIITGYSALAKKKSSATSDQEAEADVSTSYEMGLPRMVSRQVEINVNDEDRDDVTIELTDGGRILGTVTMVDGSAPPQIPISVDQVNKPDFLMNLPYPSEADGTFLLQGISAGEVRLDVELFGHADLYLKSITLGGQDLMREPLRVNEGGEISGVRITLDKGLATLTGRVQWKEDGSPVAGAGVLLVRADPKLWNLRSSRWFVNADAAGVFALQCPPGDYLAFTWSAGGQPLEAIGDFLRAQAATARPVSLQSKEEKQIELTVSRPRK